MGKRARIFWLISLAVLLVTGAVADATTTSSRSAHTAKSGKPGPRGPRGRRGFRGATGHRGVTGADGAAGRTGATGPQGVTGATGATSATGLGSGVPFTVTTAATSSSTTPAGTVIATVGDTTWGYACWDNGTTLTSDWQEAPSSASLTYDFYEFHVETSGTTATSNGAVGTSSSAAPIFADGLGSGVINGSVDALANEGATGTAPNTKVGLDPMVQLTYHVTPTVIDSAQLRASLSAGKTTGTSSCTLSATFYTTRPS